MKQHKWEIHEDCLVCYYTKQGKTDKRTQYWIAGLIGIHPGKVSARMRDFLLLRSGKFPNWHYSKQEIYVNSIL